MGQYILKRLLLILPTLFVISVVCFFLSKLTIGDAIDNRFEQTTEAYSFTSITKQWDRLGQLKKNAGLTIPYFYFSIHRKSSSDTLHKIPDPVIRESLANLSYAVGSWEVCNNFYAELKQKLYSSILSNEEKAELLGIIREKEPKVLIDRFRTSSVTSKKLLTIIKQVDLNGLHLNNLLLKFNWNGLNNQYHKWIVNFFSGNYGVSYTDGRSVKNKISTALYWTILLSLISITLAFLIGTITGVYAAKKQHSFFDRFFSYLFYSFYSLPVFWVATLLIVFLAGGYFLNLFPSYGLGNIPEQTSLWNRFLTRAHHLALPITCLTYGSIAFIFKHVKSSMLRQLSSDYIITARAKGVSSDTVLWKHAFKNASFPLITMIGSILPAVVSGSFIVEYIFSIPGMGKLMVDSILSRDYPIVFTILMLSSTLGVLGILLADILYFLNDPRLSFKSKSVT